VCAIAAGLQSSSRVVAQQPAVQTPPRPPVFRNGVAFVSVDAFPRRDGKVVEGLTKQDFEILEDGKPQAVETFEFVHIDANPADADRRDPGTVADAERQAADPHNRLFVVFLDLAHTTVVGSHDARRPIVDFLARTIGANDLFAMMTAETPVSQLAFGRRTESIEAQLSQMWTWGQADRAVMARTPYEQRLETCGVMMGSPTLGDVLVQVSREDMLQSSLENLMARLRDLRDERTNVLFISEGWVPQRDMAALTAVTGGEIPGIGIGTPVTNRAGAETRSTLNDERAWCGREIGRLSSIDFERRFRDLLTTATRANVSFYPIDVGGLKAPAEGRADVARPDAAATRNASARGSLDTLRELADNTDGYAVVNTNDLSAGVRRVSDDLSSYYLLGYYSTNAARDGRFRRIEVKVKTKDVSVSARRGYYAPTPESAAAAAAAAVPAEIDNEIARLSRLRRDAEIFSYAVPTSSGADVAVEIASSAAAQDRWRGGAPVDVTLTAADGTTASATGRIEPGARSTLVSVPIDRRHPGPWTTAVRAGGDGERAQDQTQMEVVSGVLLGAPMAWRATPSPRSPLLPLADFQLTRRDRLHVEWPILQDAATRTARLLDRRGQPLGQPLPVSAAPDGRHAAAVDLPIASLPEGDFVLELAATSGAGQTERRVLAFRVVR
jgi:VWFA-related protein